MWPAFVLPNTSLVMRCTRGFESDGVMLRAVHHEPAPKRRASAEASRAMRDILPDRNIDDTDAASKPRGPEVTVDQLRASLGLYAAGRRCRSTGRWLRAPSYGRQSARSRETGAALNACRAVAQPALSAHAQHFEVLAHHPPRTPSGHAPTSCGSRLTAATGRASEASACVEARGGMPACV
jgi:hypothetical protein